MDKNAIYKISYGLYVVSSKKSDKFEGCVVNSVIQLTSKPLTLALSCVNENLTCDAVKESREFVLSILSENVDPFVIGNFGFQSGRDCFKWANVPFTMYNNFPVVKDAAGYIHCKVKEQTNLGTHTLFICEVVDCKDGNGKPLTYEYYQTNLKAAALKAFNKFKGIETPEDDGKNAKWVCKICGYVYNGEVPFEELPEDWVCPLCKHPKSDFEKQ